MSGDLFPCPNPKCGTWNPGDRDTCVRCRADLTGGGGAERVAAAQGDRKRSLTILGAIVLIVVGGGFFFIYGQAHWFDSDPPKLVVDTPSKDHVSVKGAELLVSGVLQDQHPARVVSGSASVDVDSDGKFTLHAPVGPQGGEVDVVGYDKAGNASEPFKVQVAVDKVPPVLSGVSPVDGSSSIMGSIHFSGTSSEPLAVVKLGPAIGTPTTAGFEGDVELKAGANAILVHVEDAAGNAAEQTINVTFSPAKLPDGVTAAGRNAQGADTFHAAKDGSILALVPGGPFTMGAAGFDPDEAPAHQVQVSDFLIDTQLVTNAQYKKFCDETARELPAAPDWDENYVDAEPQAPVVNVSLKDAQDYAAWAGRRLPTEAEWEKAARGTDARKFPWGADPPAGPPPRANVKGKGDGFDNTSPAGTFAPGASPFGVLDMAGNVWEWCSDVYSAKYYGDPASAGPDPQGPASGGDHAVRGGSFRSDPDGVRTTNRDKKGAGDKAPNCGFRTALTLSKG